MIGRRAALAATLFTFASALSAPGAPLLDLAARSHYETLPHAAENRRRAAAAQHELGSAPAPAACGGTLGAPRFAELWRTLAEARAAQGDSAGAVAAYRRALDCTPRSASLHGDLCLELMNLGERAAARANGERGTRVDGRDYSSNACLAELDFTGGRWGEASAGARRLVALSADDDLATYWQMLLWIAQRRSGVREPTLEPREPAGDWPGALLDFLQGHRDEVALVALLERESDDLSRREHLCEALFYAGELRLAAGEAALAGKYFAAAVNLKVPYFTEHHLALAELGAAQR